MGKLGIQKGINADPTYTSEIYRQDCEFYRYQDKLMWGRFQTVATIEGAFLYARFAKLDAIAAYQFCLLLSAALLLFVLSIAAVKDHFDGRRYLARIKEFESRHPLIASGWQKNVAVYLIGTALILINLVNLFLLCTISK